MNALADIPLAITRGLTFVLDLTFHNVDLTGATVRMQVRANGIAAPLLDLSSIGPSPAITVTIITNPDTTVDSRVVWTADAATTAAITTDQRANVASYDSLATYPSTKEIRLLKSSVVIDSTVTVP